MADVANAEPYILVREMGYTQKEFVNNFSSLTAKNPFQINNNIIEMADNHRRLVIELGPDQQRQIASLTIPKIIVTFRFYYYEKSAIDNFLQRFDLHFHRGGG